MDDIKKINLRGVDWKSSRKFFDSLKEELKKLDDRGECYEFTWGGNQKAIIEAGVPINKTLRLVEEKSKDFENTEIFYIEGDNLDALKLLQESFLNKIKMIYIDQICTALIRDLGLLFFKTPLYQPKFSRYKLENN